MPEEYDALDLDILYDIYEDLLVAENESLTRYDYQVSLQEPGLIEVRQYEGFDQTGELIGHLKFIPQN